MKSGDKVCIGMVNDGSLNALLALDLLQIIRQKDSKFDHFVQVGNKGLTTRSRNIVVKTFLETTNSEWLLMIDSDERLGVENFYKLCNAAHDKERPIVSGLVFAAFFDDEDALRAVPTIYRDLGEQGLSPMDDYPEDEVIEVDAVGTGCLMIHRSVFEYMQENANENQGKDWAWFAEGAIKGTYFGEDLLFSKRLKSFGYKIHAHTGAILPHQKEFWLDQRHHKAIRDFALKQDKA